MPLFLIEMPEWVERLAAALGTEPGLLVRQALRIVAIWLLAWIALVAVRIVARRIEKSVDDGNDLITTQREKRGHTISQLIRGVGRIVVVIAGFLLTLDVFMDIAPILGGAAILGLAFSFGAQSLVKDIITGFFMLAEDQFAVGDIVEVAGKSGVVEKITLRVVILRDLEGVVHTVPNGEITTVSNRTRGWSRALLEIGVGYGEDVDHVLEVFRDEARRFSEDAAWADRLDGPLEVPGVESLADSAVVVRVLARSRPGSQWDVAREFRRRIKNRLDAEGIEIPFPQRVLHMRPVGAGEAAPDTDDL